MWIIIIIIIINIIILNYLILWHSDISHGPTELCCLFVLSIGQLFTRVEFLCCGANQH